MSWQQTQNSRQPYAQHGQDRHTNHKTDGPTTTCDPTARPKHRSARLQRCRDPKPFHAPQFFDVLGFRKYQDVIHNRL
eukprot:1494269-Amphidinium_carterae.1